MKGVIRPALGRTRKRWLALAFGAGMLFGPVLLVLILGIERETSIGTGWSISFSNELDRGAFIAVEPIGTLTDVSGEPTTTPDRLRFELRPGEQRLIQGHGMAGDRNVGPYMLISAPSKQTESGVVFEYEYVRGVQVLEGTWDCVIKRDENGFLVVSYVSQAPPNTSDTRETWMPADSGFGRP